MAKIDQAAFTKIVDLLNKGQLIQIEQTSFCYEVTVWPDKHNRLQHSHYQGETLIEAIMKISS